MNAPLAIDLYCGLASREPEFVRATESTVEQFMAGRTENPNHMRLRVLDLAKGAISAMLGPMRKLHDPVFSARLARGWKFGMLSAQPNHYTRVFVFAPAAINLPDCWILAMKGASRFLRRLSRTIIRTVTPVGCWRDDLKVAPADTAITAVLGHIRLLITTTTACATLTSDRTVPFVGASCGETSPA